MPAFLTENVLFWAVAAAGLVAFGGALSRGTGKKAFLWLGAALGVSAAGLGLYLVFCVPTDRKAIRETIFETAAAVANNDIEGVARRLDPDEYRLGRAAERALERAEVEWAKVRDFEIREINYHTSPPRAIVSFRASAGGADENGEFPFTVVLHFTEVELRRDADGAWRITDRCEFRLVGGDVDSDPQIDNYGEIRF